MADCDVKGPSEDSSFLETAQLKEDNDLTSEILNEKVSENYFNHRTNSNDNSEPSTSNISELKSTDVPSSSNEPEDSDWLDILGSGHLKKKVLTKGKPDSRPSRGDTVILSVIGKLDDGTEFENLENVDVCIGDAEVVQGIEYALPLMDDGETAQIVVSPRFGYGSLGYPPRVPKDATLHYIVSIKDVIELRDIHSLSLEDRLTIGLKKKERGNWWYQRKENHLAIQCYRKALQYFEEDLSARSDEINEARLKTYNNLSVAHFNIEAYDAALTSVNNVLSQEPSNIKAIYRKVKILKAQGEIEEAISVAKKGLKNKPDSPALQDELNVLLEIRKKSTSAQKVLYRKMFQNPDGTDKKDEKRKTVISVTWKWLGIITVAVGIIGAAAIKYKF